MTTKYHNAAKLLHLTQERNAVAEAGQPLAARRDELGALAQQLESRHRQEQADLKKKQAAELEQFNAQREEAHKAVLEYEKKWCAAEQELQHYINHGEKVPDATIPIAFPDANVVPAPEVTS